MVLTYTYRHPGAYRDPEHLLLVDSLDSGMRRNDKIALNDSYRHPGAYRDPERLMAAVRLDDSLRSPCGPTYSRSTRFALLSGMRRND